MLLASQIGVLTGLLQHAEHGAALNECLEASAGTKCSGTGSHGCLSYSTCTISALQSALVASMLPDLMQGAGLHDLGLG